MGAPNIKNWLEYYKASLIEGRQRSYSDMILLERIMVGGEIRIDRLTLEELEFLLKDKASRQGSLWEKFEQEEKPFSVEVEIAPIALVEEWVDGSRKIHYPFWIPAVLDREGRLSPPEDEELPLILRGHLSPNADDKPVLAKLEAFDELLRECTFETGSWEAYWKSSEHFFQEVSKRKFEDFHPQAGRIQMGLVLADHGNFIRHIQGLYNFLRKKNPKAIPQGPLQEILQKSPENYQLSPEEVFLSTPHLGQIQRDFPLSPSQRKALSSFLHDKCGKVFAVNGPPGTGKTTMLQSIIAHYVVQHVLEEKEPPLIIGCSNSNQAIRNILDSMNLQNGEGKSILGKRWLKDMDSMGLYLTSQKNVKDREYDQYLRISDSWYQGGSLKKIDNKKLVKSFENYFVDQYLAFQSGKGEGSIELTDIKKELKEAIRQKKQDLDALVKGESSKKGIQKRAEEADITVRFELFWLCLHYRELEFIELLKNKDEEAKERSKQAFRAKLRRIARACPLFISTFYTLPRYSTYYGREGDAYYQPLYDLMIVDEAGQVSPEVAWPNFSLAKKLLVVGDVHQLEPIWGLSPQVDFANARRFHLVKSFTQFEEYAQQGLMVSSGNVMKLAKEATSIAFLLSGSSNQTEKGALLTEHRRCMDDIMEFSNTYVYQKGLELMVGNDHGMSHRLPPLGYLEVEGTGEKHKGSRRNKEEAYAIVEFIASQKEAWEGAYGLELPQILGIITPFVAQKILIQKNLKEILGIEVDKTWKIGTVHALQGAERPIVLFSPVYHSTYGTLFFDQENKYNMLNVALSRAKHSFIIIGNTKIFDSGDENPSGNLGKILFSKEGSRLNERFGW